MTPEPVSFSVGRVVFFRMIRYEMLSAESQVRVPNLSRRC